MTNDNTLDRLCQTAENDVLAGVILLKGWYRHQGFSDNMAYRKALEHVRVMIEKRLTEARLNGRDGGH